MRLRKREEKILCIESVEQVPPAAIFFAGFRVAEMKIVEGVAFFLFFYNLINIYEMIRDNIQILS